LDLPAEERRRLAVLLWDSVAEHEVAAVPSDAQRIEIDRRLDELEKFGSRGRPWELVRAELEARRIRFNATR
jgi:putative addiction module component (TIGR02574 family)